MKGGGGGDKKNKKQREDGKKNFENVEKLEMLGNFRKRKNMGRGLGGV